MNILHLVRGLTNSSGTTHIVGPLSEAQARLGHHLSVWFVEKGQEPAVTPDPSLVESRVFAQLDRGQNTGISTALAGALHRDIRRFDVVHIHAVWNFPTWWTMRAASRAGVPYVVAPQGSFEPWALGQSALKKKLYGALTEIPLLNRATAIQAVSTAEEAQIRAAGITAPVAVIPNGIDPAAFSAAVPPADIAQGKQRDILFLSRLHPKKGADILIRAFALVAADDPGVRLRIAGGDAGSGYAASLKALAASLGIADKCSFLGEVRGAAKVETLAEGGIFVLPSHSEGLPVAVLEAMATGLPVIITPGCNLPEVASGGTGIIVNPDPGAIAAAMRRLLDSPAEAAAMGAAGRRLVAERFTWARIAEQCLALYARILGSDVGVSPGVKVSR